MVILILVLLGLSLGSFTNALVWRMHEQSKSKKPSKKLSITQGRSMCPDCKHALAWYDLLPVISWLSLAGKCRYCKKPIPFQYPLVEVFMALLFVASYIWWPYGWGAAGWLRFAAWLIILIILVALFVYDLRWMLLPNRVVYPLILLVAVQTIVLVALGQGFGVIASAFWGVLCLAGLFYGLFQVSGGKWIGGGDVKLAVALGLLAGGPVSALLLLFVASLLGCTISVPLLVMKKKHYSSRVPFGPFLIAATIIVYIFGATLTTWYKKQFLLI